MSLSLGPCVPALGLYVQVSGLHRVSKGGPTPSSPWSLGLAWLVGWGEGRGSPRCGQPSPPGLTSVTSLHCLAFPELASLQKVYSMPGAPACQGLPSGAWFSYLLLYTQPPSTWTAMCHEVL